MVPYMDYNVYRWTLGTESMTDHFRFEELGNCRCQNYPHFIFSTLEKKNVSQLVDGRWMDRHKC